MKIGVKRRVQREVGGVRGGGGVGRGGADEPSLVWLGVICSNLLHVNLSEQREPDYPSNNGHTLIC